MRRLAFVAALIAVRSAAAEPSGDDLERARAADRSARAHYDAREYAAAIADYQSAFDALADPLFLFDIAQAYRQLHDCDRALAHYRRYLDARPDADNRPKVEQFIAEMTACATPQPAAPTPPPAPRSEPPPPPPSPSPSRSLELAGIATAALGVVLVGTGIYFSVEARGDATQLEAACARGCAGSAVAEIDRAGRDANHDAITTYALGGTALAGGAAMVLWALLHAPGEPPIVAPTPGGATVSARMRF